MYVILYLCVTRKVTCMYISHTQVNFVLGYVRGKTYSKRLCSYNCVYFYYSFINCNVLCYFYNAVHTITK